MTNTSYVQPQLTDLPPKRFVALSGAADHAVFTFYDRIEVGRFRENASKEGCLLVKDPTISSRHCVVTQEADGRCFVRDVSRNGTRLDGRRLSPNLKFEIMTGQVLTVGSELQLRLEGDTPIDQTQEGQILGGTVAVSTTTNVTVLVGDIRNYTVLVQRLETAEVQDSVGRVFSRLEKEIENLGGTVKEFQGDAIFAFWEQGSSLNHANEACRAALEMDRLSKHLAADAEVWKVEDFPLELDWALASGVVVISGHGDGNALGLTMVGEPVVLAFRMEKFASDQTGRIVCCPATQRMATEEFQFRDLGTRQAKGFDQPQRLFALVGRN